MGVLQWRLGMITENKEGFSDFNIDPEWYKNHKPGISAIVRCYGDEDIVGICLESILPLFDEIIVTYTPVKNDRTEDICKSFKNSKIKCFKYPFNLLKNNYHWMERSKRSYENFRSSSVYDLAYYTNWSLSKCKYSHVAPRWDVDQILRPEYATSEFHDLIIINYMVRVSGYNVLSKNCTEIADENPFQGPEVRFHTVNYFTYFTGSLSGAEGLGFRVMDSLPYDLTMGLSRTTYTWLNYVVGRIPLVNSPIFFHLKYIREKKPEKSIHTKAIYNIEKVTPRKIDVMVPSFMMKTAEDYL